MTRITISVDLFAGSSHHSAKYLPSWCIDLSRQKVNHFSGKIRAGQSPIYSLPSPGFEIHHTDAVAEISGGKVDHVAEVVVYPRYSVNLEGGAQGLPSQPMGEETWRWDEKFLQISRAVSKQFGRTGNLLSLRVTGALLVMSPRFLGKRLILLAVAKISFQHSLGILG
jgi:hypothetical protein